RPRPRPRSARHRGTDMSAVEDTPTTKHVGRSLRRKEDPRLITVRSRYTDDIVLPGTLYVAFVRSPEAHAKIVSIDPSAAKARDGVVAVYTGEDMDAGGPMPTAWVPPGVTVNTPAHWPNAKGQVNHGGSPAAP